MSRFWRIFFVIIVTAKQQAKADSADKFSNAFTELVNRIYEELPFKSIFLQRRQAEDCINENLQRKFELPILSLGSNKTIYLKGNYSSEMLAILCMKNSADKALLELLAVNLQHMRSTRIMAIINADFAEESGVTQLINFFELCQKLKIININVIHRNFYSTQYYHSYTQFPEFQLETNKLTAEALLFPDRLKNLYGKVLLTLPDQIEPRTMLYTDAKGRQRMSGYIGKLLHAFEEQHNFTLRLPYPYNMSNDHVIYLLEISEAAFNGSLDIAASSASASRDLRIHEFTYPHEIAQWLVMVPIKNDIPMNILMTSFLKIDFVSVLILQCLLLSILLALQMAKVNRTYHCISPLDVFCNDASLRGILGQTFKMTKRPSFGIKYTYFLMFIGGLVFSTSFSTYLIKLLTVPPTLKPISSFDEALKLNIKICLAEQEIPTIANAIGDAFWQKYKSVFFVTKTYNEFQINRRTMKLPYGYPITTSLWPVVKEQQKYFSRDLYQLTQNMYISHFMLFGLPLNENSIYLQPLNRFIHRIHDSGLFQCWFRMTFYDMVALNRISFKDLSKPYTIRALKVADLYWIWIMYSAAMCFAILEFIVEKFVLKRKDLE